MIFFKGAATPIWHHFPRPSFHREFEQTSCDFGRHSRGSGMITSAFKPCTIPLRCSSSGLTKRLFSMLSSSNCVIFIMKLNAWGVGLCAGCTPAATAIAITMGQNPGPKFALCHCVLFAGDGWLKRDKVYLSHSRVRLCAVWR